MTKHQMTDSPEYQAWQHAKKRCNNPNDKEFHRYGAKGTRMAPEWEADFLAFFNEMGVRPSPAHSLDRIKAHLGYQPGNCRWATKRVQAQNRPTFARVLTHRGKSQTVAEWAREIGLPATTLYARLNKGIPVDEALSMTLQMPGAPPRLLTHNGECHPLKVWARLLGMKPTTIRERLKRGWTVEKALQPL